MNRNKVQQLKHGVYRIYWKGCKNYSVASIGSTSDGSRWLAPANWISGHSSEEDTWDRIDHVELIEEAKYDQEEKTKKKKSVWQVFLNIGFVCTVISMFIDLISVMLSDNLNLTVKMIFFFVLGLFGLIMIGAKQNADKH